MNCFRADAPVPFCARSDQLAAEQSSQAGVRALMSVKPLEGRRNYSVLRRRHERGQILKAMVLEAVGRPLKLN
jgi:hypothetical protein